MLSELFYCQKSKLREAGLARLTFQENMLIGQKKSACCPHQHVFVEYNLDKIFGLSQGFDQNVKR